MTLLVIGASVSSLSFTPQAQARSANHPDTITPAPESGTNIHVAVIGGAFAAYGWLAARSYDLGKEIGKSLAHSPRPRESIVFDIPTSVLD